MPSTKLAVLDRDLPPLTDLLATYRAEVSRGGTATDRGLQTAAEIDRGVTKAGMLFNPADVDHEYTEDADGGKVGGARIYDRAEAGALSFAAGQVDVLERPRTPRDQVTGPKRRRGPIDVGR